MESEYSSHVFHIFLSGVQIDSTAIKAWVPMAIGRISFCVHAARGRNIGVASFVPDITTRMRGIKTPGLNDFTVYFLSHFTTPFEIGYQNDPISSRTPGL